MEVPLFSAFLESFQVYQTIPLLARLRGSRIVGILRWNIFWRVFMNKWRPLIITPVFMLLAQAAVGQADPVTVAKIVDEGKNHNQIMQHLDYLTHKIGPRLTASPKLDKAYAWTQKRFKEFGCKNVHLQEWGEYNVGFDRGKKQIARMVAPTKLDFEFTTPSWSPGTKGLVRGPAVAETITMEEFEKGKEKIKGAWGISKKKGFGTRANEPTDLNKAIHP